MKIRTAKELLAEIRVFREGAKGALSTTHKMTFPEYRKLLPGLHLAYSAKGYTVEISENTVTVRLF